MELNKIRKNYDEKLVVNYFENRGLDMNCNLATDIFCGDFCIRMFIFNRVECAYKHQALKKLIKRSGKSQKKFI